MFAGSPFHLPAGVSLASIRGALRKVSLSRLSHPEQAQPVRHYAREHRGELIHLDTKSLVRFSEVGYRISGDREVQSDRFGVGWEYVHAYIDYTTNHSFTEILPNQKNNNCQHLPSICSRILQQHLSSVTRVITDNVSYYEAFVFRDACKHLRLRHMCTTSLTPRTGGKAKCFIKTLLTEWAYARAYSSSHKRAAELPISTHSTICNVGMADSMQNHHYCLKPTPEQPVEVAHLAALQRALVERRPEFITSTTACAMRRWHITCFSRITVQEPRWQKLANCTDRQRGTARARYQRRRG